MVSNYYTQNINVYIFFTDDVFMMSVNTLKNFSANLTLKPAITFKSSTDLIKLAVSQISSIHDIGQTMSSPKARMPILCLEMVERVSISLLHTLETTPSDNFLTCVGLIFRGAFIGSINQRCVYELERVHLSQHMFGGVENFW